MLYENDEGDEQGLMLTCSSTPSTPDFATDYQTRRYGNQARLPLVPVNPVDFHNCLDLAIATR